MKLGKGFILIKVRWIVFLCAHWGWWLIKWTGTLHQVGILYGFFFCFALSVYWKNLDPGGQDRAVMTPLDFKLISPLLVCSFSHWKRDGCQYSPGAHSTYSSRWFPHTAFLLHWFRGWLEQLVTCGHGAGNKELRTVTKHWLLCGLKMCTAHFFSTARLLCAMCVGKNNPSASLWRVAREAPGVCVMLSVLVPGIILIPRSQNIHITRQVRII